MTTRRVAPPARSSLFPRTSAEAAADALAAASRAVDRTRAERLSAATVAAARHAVAQRPALARAARPRSLGPLLPLSELYGAALAIE
jgi:hypothetical protein